MNEADQILKLTAAGLNEVAIAKRLHRSRYWLSASRAKYGIPRPQRQRHADRPIPLSLSALNNAAEEARNLLPLLNRADASETPEKIKKLISVDDHDLEFLKAHFNAENAQRVAAYRSEILTAFENLIAAKEGI